MADHDVKIQIKTYVEGLGDVKGLATALRELLGLAAKEVKDPTGEIGRNAAAAGIQIDKAAKKTADLNKEISGLNKQPLVSPASINQPRQAAAAMDNLKSSARAAGAEISSLNQKQILPDAPKQINKTAAAANGLGQSLKALAIGAVVIRGLKEMASLAGIWTDLQSRVKLATGGMEDAGYVLERLGEIANRAYSPLEKTAESFLSNATTLNALGVSTETQLDLADALTSALVVSGAKGQQFDMVMNAINRSMAVGKLSGEELNTVLKYGGAVAETLAGHLKVNVTELKALGAEGKLTAEVITEALVGSLESLQNKADAMPATIGDAFVRLRNKVLIFAGAFNEVSAAEALVVEILVSIGETVDWLTAKFKSDSASWLKYLAQAPAFVVMAVKAAIVHIASMLDQTIVRATAVGKTIKAVLTGSLQDVVDIWREANQEIDNIAQARAESLEEIFTAFDDISSGKTQELFTETKKAAAEARGLAEALRMIEVPGEMPETLADSVKHLQELTKESKEAKAAALEFARVQAEAAVAMITREAENARIQGNVDAYNKLISVVELYQQTLAEARKTEKEAADITAQRLKNLKALGMQTGGAALIDLSGSMKGLESAKKSFAESMEAMIQEAKKAQEAINKALAESGLSPQDKKRLETEYKAHTERILEFEEALVLGKKKLEIDWLAEQKIRREEAEKGEKLTAEAKKKIYGETIAVFIKGEFERENAAERANIAASRSAAKHMGDIIKAFEATAAAGTAAGQAILVGMNLAKQGLEATADLSEKTLKEEFERRKKELEGLLSQFSAGLAGGRKGGGKSDDGLGLLKTQLAEQKRMAEFEAQQTEKAMLKAVRAGEMAYAEYIQRRLETAKGLGELEVQTAEQTLARLSALRDKAGAKDRARYEQDIIKAQNDLAIAQARAPEAMENAYREAFGAIAEEHARLQATMQSQQEMVRLQMEAGILSQAQGQRQLNEITRQYLPILEQIAAIFGEEIAKLEAMGFDVTELKRKFEELRLTNEQVKNTLSQTAAAINEVFESSFSTFLSDLSQDIKNVTELFKTFVKTVLQGLAQIASQQIASSLFSAMGRASGGIGGFFGRIFNFAGGGRVSGPGTDTSDNILSWLSPGEFVLRARAVRELISTFGYGFLDFVNNFDRLPKTMFPGYAEGGLIGGHGQALALASKIDPGQTMAQLENLIKLNINTTFDKEGFLKTVVDSPQFEKKIMSTNFREAKTLTKILRGGR